MVKHLLVVGHGNVRVLECPSGRVWGPTHFGRQPWGIDSRPSLLWDLAWVLTFSIKGTVCAHYRPAQLDRIRENSSFREASQHAARSCTHQLH